MSFRLFKLRFRRLFKRRRRRLSEVSSQADEHMTRHFFRRLHHLLLVRRFLALWIVPILLLIGLTGWQTLALSGYYTHLVPAPGGIYREGIIGTFTNANPIYATSIVDQSVSRLIFASLYQYNGKNQLVGDLASGLKVSPDDRTYTVQLRPGLTWQDGRPLTASDVAFTYHLVQDPLAQSPYFSNWQDVQIEATGPLTVSFKLPNPLASFKYSLTLGIVPKHLLAKIHPDRLRSSDFNTVNPVGAGPFMWSELSVKGDEPASRQELIALKAFPGYYSGEAALGGIVIHAYPSAELATQDLLAKNIDGLAGLNDVPTDLQGEKVETFWLPLTAETAVFFKESNPILSDVKVRQALVMAADRNAIVTDLPFKTDPALGPLLPFLEGYDPKYNQPGFDLAAAKQLLQSDGWVAGTNGILQKAGQPLRFSLFVADQPEFRNVARALSDQWKQLGADVDVQVEADSDFKNTVATHDYDAVLKTISLGTDPDQYVYWDSSQADVRSASRLNLSELKDKSVDAALEAGRTRLDPAIRAVKYQKFLSAWHDNYPALILYQPRLLYVTNAPLYNFDPSRMVNSAIGRFNNVTSWEIRQQKVSY